MYEQRTRGTSRIRTQHGAQQMSMTRSTSRNTCATKDSEHTRKVVYIANSTSRRGLQQTNDKFVSYEFVPPIECLILSIASCAV